MKFFKYFLMAFTLCFATVAGFTSCSNDEDEDDMGQVDDNASMGIKDNGKELVLTYKTTQGNYWAKVAITATFDGSSDTSKCIKCIAKFTTNVPGEEGYTEDMTDEYRGLTKREVKAAFEYLHGVYQ